MELRIAKEEDLERILELRFENAMYHSNVLGGNVIRMNAKEVLKEHTHHAFHDLNARIIVVLINDIIIGYVIGFINQEHPIFDFGRQGLIDDVYVKVKNQGEGCGKNLIDELFKWFEEEKVTTVQLNVYQANTLGLNFWEKMDFKTLFQRMAKEL